MKNLERNPWEDILLEDYENHMKLENIRQLQTLNGIINEQLYRYAVSEIAILGIAGGNGLEHVDPAKIKTVYGIDINQDYLDACKKRFPGLSSTLVTKKMDLSDDGVVLPDVDLVIADLTIEYIGISHFINGLKKTHPAFVSCVIQQNFDGGFVSESPYAELLSDLSDIHQDIDETDLSESMKGSGYELVFREDIPLPNSKSFICLDFKYSRVGI